MIKCPLCGSEKYHTVVEKTWGEGWTRLFLADTDCPVTLRVCSDCGIIYVSVDDLKKIITKIC